ncbi:PH domain-containing protein [Candidatus Laterigemmans baculatus]|uniref:PH domain-containing protein n=1 Tax=Candidatus Laterigemmans baculatus TaxID=2770505 RepID=UPI0013D8E2CE|nr:PH domain-containing protein [Candidatus Laterigemmans baculatus]
MIDDQDDRRGAEAFAGTEPEGPMAPRKNEPAPRAAGPDGVDESARERFDQRVKSSREGGLEEESEETLWQGGYSPKAMVGTWILCLLLTVAAIVATVMVPELPWLVTLIAVVVLWAIVASVYAARRLGVHYQLTTQRFIHQTGILSRRTDRIEVIDINDVSYEQGPVQRMFGIGSIRIDSSDRSHPVLTMRGISDVHRVAGLVDDIRRKERRRRSLHIESI